MAQITIKILALVLLMLKYYALCAKKKERKKEQERKRKVICICLDKAMHLTHRYIKNIPFASHCRVVLVILH